MLASQGSEVFQAKKVQSFRLQKSQVEGTPRMPGMGRCITQKGLGSEHKAVEQEIHYNNTQR